MAFSYHRRPRWLNELSFPQYLAPFPDILPQQRRRGRLVSVFSTDSRTSFVTTAREELELTLEGIPSDRHCGFVRKSGSREPWYPRGTPIRSRRQLSILSVEELGEIAHLMTVADVRAEWLGGNLLVEGIDRLTFLPFGTRLHFEGGAVVLGERQNRPCRHSGAVIAQHFPERGGLDLLFVESATRLRGLLASVERAGIIRPGEAFDAVIPEQWIYSVG